jgi:murein DD-endopeptidase MepM/ murein hydrolase activator NlpD
MIKSKFKYNPDTLSFDKDSLNSTKKFWRFFNYFLFSLVVSIVYYIIFSAFFDTPAERGQRRENQDMLEKLDQFNKRFEHLTAVLEDIKQRDVNIYRTIFEAEPISNYSQQDILGGVERLSYLEDLSNNEIVKETSKRLEKLSKQVYIQSKSFDEIRELLRKNSDMIACIPAIQPIANRDLHRVASPFGVRMHPFYKVLKMHTGMDFTASIGTEVLATGNGVVSDIIPNARGYGNTVIIDHGYGYKTLYAHLSTILVKVGKQVKRGNVIALVGNSGMSMAPHLHYEIRKNDAPINPINFFFNELTPREYNKIILIASQSGQSLD